MVDTQVEKNTALERDPWFNPYRCPASERATGFVNAVLYGFEQRESRKRARRTKDREMLWRVCHALFADLAYHYLDGSPGSGLVVPRNTRALQKPSRYYPPYFIRSFPTLLDGLERLKYIKQKKGKYSGRASESRQTTIRAGTKLIELIKTHEVAFEDFAADEAEEVIILKRPKRDHWDKGERIEYKDTAITERLRAEVRAINVWLHRADIKFDPAAHEEPVDARARRLFRYFAGDFKSGGRLFKGFWETLPKQARLLGLRIEGEPVVGLDYAQLNPMLAYAEIGSSPPSGDAYDLPSLEGHRDGVKKVFNALLFDKKARTRFPTDAKALFSPKVKIGDVVGGIRQKHPLLTSVLSTGAGFRLMYRESEIMMRVLEELRRQAIVGLPVHDAVIVKGSKADAVMAIMKGQFKKATGLEIQVRLEDPFGL